MAYLKGARGAVRAPNFFSITNVQNICTIYDPWGRPTVTAGSDHYIQILSVYLSVHLHISKLSKTKHISTDGRIGGGPSGSLTTPVLLSQIKNVWGTFYPRYAHFLPKSCGWYTAVYYWSTWPVVITVFIPVVRPSVPSFQNQAKQNRSILPGVLCGMA